MAPRGSPHASPGSVDADDPLAAMPPSPRRRQHGARVSDEQDPRGALLGGRRDDAHLGPDAARAPDADGDPLHRVLTAEWSPRLRGLARRAELVARAAQRLERQRVAQLRAQAAHVDVDRARAALVAAAPDAREQRLAREDPAAVRREEREQRELLGRQRDPPALDADLVGRAIDERARRSSGAPRSRTRSAATRARGCARRARRERTA